MRDTSIHGRDLGALVRNVDDQVELARVGDMEFGEAYGIGFYGRAHNGVRGHHVSPPSSSRLLLTVALENLASRIPRLTLAGVVKNENDELVEIHFDGEGAAVAAAAARLAVAPGRRAY